MTVCILGIDPGSVCTGFGIIRLHAGKTEYVASGVVRPKSKALGERLHSISTGISEQIAQWQPNEVAIEDVFVNRNVRSALKLGQARGVAICAAAAAGHEPYEYAPRLIKQAVVGSGAADKTQVQHMVRAILGLRQALIEDEADALAVALCHAHSRSLPAQYAALAGRRRA